MCSCNRVFITGCDRSLQLRNALENTEWVIRMVRGDKPVHSPLDAIDMRFQEKKVVSFGFFGFSDLPSGTSLLSTPGCLKKEVHTSKNRGVKSYRIVGNTSHGGKPSSHSESVDHFVSVKLGKIHG